METLAYKPFQPANEMNVQLDEGAYMPERAYNTDGGADLRTPNRLVIRPHDSVVVDTGVHFDIPAGIVGLLKSKSGLNVKCSLVTEGVIDAGYSGSVVVKLYNHGGETRIIEKGEKITQILFTLVWTPGFRQVEKIEGGDRGANGFGSTGR